MSYISKCEIQSILDTNEKYRDRLFCRGFLVTTTRVSDLDGYPFYGNWNEYSIKTKNTDIYIYIQKYTTLTQYEKDSRVFFIIGHAYNPFSMQYKETDILESLSTEFSISEDKFWEKESELTGVFCLGYVEKGSDKLVVTTDCAGMQMVYYGMVDDQCCITSHSKLIADMYNLEQPEYIQRLVKNKFWKFWGTWLPGDLSPYDELKRLVPNCKATFTDDQKQIAVERYYPTHKIVESEEDYEKTIKELGRIMSNNMELIAKKWSDKKVSISVTGGRDSMATLACTNGQYDKYSYFSYISNDEESVDAFAARDILKSLSLNHELIRIPEEWEGYSDIDVFKKILECNAGCIGANNSNDVKKRMYFCSEPPCDIEVKSWVNEIGRGRCYDRFKIKRFPQKSTPSYWRTLHKAYIYDFKLMKSTDKVFKEYLDKYYGNDEFEKLFWIVYYHWEFSWAGGEGVFLTAEQRISNEITIPFNNRKYLELMLTVPLEKRKTDSIPQDLIKYKNSKIAETNIWVKDVSHTDIRAYVERIHLEVYSRIKFRLNK